jgi:hypothetical protein
MPLKKQIHGGILLAEPVSTYLTPGALAS